MSRGSQALTTLPTANQTSRDDAMNGGAVDAATADMIEPMYPDTAVRHEAVNVERSMVNAEAHLHFALSQPEPDMV